MSFEEAEPNRHFVRRHATTWFGVLGLAILACAIYIPTLNYEMIFDDIPCIVENESIHQLTPLFGQPGGHGPLNPQPLTPVTARPVVSLSLAVNYYFGQADPFGYRLTNLLLHLMTALLLWAVVSKTLRQPCFGQRFQRSHQPLSIVASMLWLVHPVHTDTVVYITQRTELLMGLFYVLTVWVAIRFWESKSWYGRAGWSILALVTSSCGMLSKEMMASVPAMVLVYEWTFLRDPLTTMAKRSWMLYAALAASWLPIVAMYQLGYNTPLGGFNNLISANDWWLTQSNSFFVYWRLVFKPWPLLLHYHVPTLTSFSQAWPGVLGLATYTLLTIYLLWRRSPAGFVLLWFFAVLSPTLIVPLPHEEISERRLYVPLFAVLPFLAIATFVLVQRLLKRGDDLLKSQWPAHAPAMLGILLFAVVSAVTVPRLSRQSEVWAAVLKHEPDNIFAIAAQGCVEFKQGKIDEGIEKMKIAFDSDPSYLFYRRSYLKALKATGRYEELLENSKVLREHAPDDPVCVYTLAVAYEQNGLIEDAIREYEKSIDLNPDIWESHSALGTLLAERGNVPQAIKHFEVATKLEPDFMNCMNLMGLYIGTQQDKKAIHTAELLLVAAKKEGQPEDVIGRIQKGLKQLKDQQQTRTQNL